MNGTLDVLREIVAAKELLREFGIDELVVEEVTGQTTWNEIKDILGRESIRFIEFMTAFERRLGRTILEDLIAQNGRLEALLLYPLAA